ncbi:hypothetical protein B5M42_009245 [Paenibacillus athensensis]|uniref:Uncharacterized protein n=1 Tax=Paenibacillus athensensis TaxID=1967502 RepID=A0A4Y8QBE1_9BACL|nr:hypothetical protein [Paenibacillus athensensis]MCD1259022.1 hypothetical protein [Paenibacillus athensensis]
MNMYAGGRRLSKKSIKRKAATGSGLQEEVRPLAGSEPSALSAPLQLRRWQETLGNRATQQLVQRQLALPSIVAAGPSANSAGAHASKRGSGGAFRPNGGSGLVVQRVLSQFRFNEEQKTEGNANNIAIADVLIAGRTPSPFTGTMGAHSTAWVAHIDAVRRQMIGYHLDEVCSYMTDFSIKQLNSPLLRLTQYIHSDHREKLKLAGESLQLAVLQIAPFKDESNITSAQPVVAGLQKLLGSLLTFVNYLPMATVAGGDPGGNGEGPARTLLNLHETAGSAKDYIDGAKEDIVSEKMKDEPSEEKLQGYGETISSYEQLLKDVKKEDSAVDLDKQEPLKKKVQEQLRKMFAAETPGVFAQTRIGKQDAQLICEIWALGLQHYLETVKSAYPYSYTLAGWNDEKQLGKEVRLLLERQAEAYEVDNEFKLQSNKNISTYILQLLRGQQGFAKLGKEHEAPLEDVLGKQAESSAAGVGLSDFASESKGTFMSSIFLDEDGKVGDVFIQGRTPKPFSSSEGMGAHSTAWTAHVDAVRTTMSGKTVKDAGGALAKLASQALSAPAFTELYDQVGEKQAYQLENAADYLRKLLDQQIDFGNLTAALGHLEQLIYLHLNFVNLTPLSTVSGGHVPGGRNEGRHRQLLQSFEQNEPEVTMNLKSGLREAMYGLFDANAIDKFSRDEDSKGKEAENLETKKWLYSLNSLMHTLKTAYPRSYAAADFREFLLDKLNAPIEVVMGGSEYEKSDKEKDVELNELSKKKKISSLLDPSEWKLGQMVRVERPYLEHYDTGVICGRLNKESQTVKVQFINEKDKGSYQIYNIIGMESYPVDEVTPLL